MMLLGPCGEPGCDRFGLRGAHLAHNVTERLCPRCGWRVREWRHEAPAPDQVGFDFSERPDAIASGRLS